MFRSINCGDVRISNEGELVTLSGWVHRRRDHGGLIFIDLRDREGLVQVVFNPELDKDIHTKAQDLRSEWVISVVGKVAQRPDGTKNPNMDTGEVEVLATTLDILNTSKTPPFSVEDESQEIDEYLKEIDEFLKETKEFLMEISINFVRKSRISLLREAYSKERKELLYWRTLHNKKSMISLLQEVPQ